MIYVYMCICVYIYIYILIYLFIHNDNEDNAKVTDRVIRERVAQHPRGHSPVNVCRGTDTHLWTALFRKRPIVFARPQVQHSRGGVSNQTNKHQLMKHGLRLFISLPLSNVEDAYIERGHACKLMALCYKAISAHHFRL